MDSIIGILGIVLLVMSGILLAKKVLKNPVSADMLKIYKYLWATMWVVFVTNLLVSDGETMYVKLGSAAMMVAIPAWFLRRNARKKEASNFKLFDILFKISVVLMVCALIMNTTTDAPEGEVEKVEKTTMATTTAPTEATRVTENTTATTEAPTTVATEAPTEAVSEMFKAIKELGYSDEHAVEIEAVLNEVGIESIRVKNMSGEAESGLNRVTIFPNGMEEAGGFTTEEGELFYVEFLSDPLYDTDLGGYLKSIDEVHIPETEIDGMIDLELRMWSEDVIKSCLKYPSEADFHTFDWRLSREDDKYIVAGSVTARNAFGVRDKMSFYVWYIDNGDKFSVTGVELDGVRLK